MKRGIRKAISVVTILVMILGLIWINPVESSAATYSVNVTTGKYFTLLNVGSSKYLNIYGNRNANKTNVDIYSKDGTSGQDFKFVNSGAGYMLIPRCATNKVLNIYAETAKSGSNVCLWETTAHSTQVWIPEYVPSASAYILRSANNRNLVLTATGTGNSSNVCVKTYSSGNKSQLWKSSAFSVTAKTTSTSTTSTKASTLGISGENKPTQLTEGSYFTIKGKVSSNYKLEYVNGWIYDSNGKKIDSSHADVNNSKSFSLANSKVDTGLEFNKLPAGTYVYYITAKDTSGPSKVLVKQNFKVVASTATSKGGTSSYNGYKILKNALTYQGKAYCQYNTEYTPVFGNQGCGSCACACAIAIIKNQNKKPTNYWKNNDDGCKLSNYGKVGETPSKSSEQTILKQCVTLINNNMPGVICTVNTKSKITHFVTLIGYKKNANINALTKNDILVMDPADGKIKTLAEAMSLSKKNQVVAVRWFKSLK